MNCGHRLVWLGHWPSMHIPCEVSPQPGTLFKSKAGIQIPVTAIYIGTSILPFAILQIYQETKMKEE
jgi:hypothetical protein